MLKKPNLKSVCATNIYTYISSLKSSQVILMLSGDGKIELASYYHIMSILNLHSKLQQRSLFNNKKPENLVPNKHSQSHVYPSPCTSFYLKFTSIIGCAGTSQIIFNLNEKALTRYGTRSHPLHMSAGSGMGATCFLGKARCPPSRGKYLRHCR